MQETAFKFLNYFTGIWPLVQTFGGLGIAVLASFVFAWFSPVYKKTAIGIGVAIITHTILYSIGVYHGESRVIAQTKAKKVHVEKVIEKVVTKSKRSATPDGVRRDPWAREDY